MGRGGSSPARAHVAKVPVSTSSDTAVIGSTAVGGYDSESLDVCLISFEATIKVPPALRSTISRNDSSVIVREKNKLTVYVNNQAVGSYSGSYRSIIAKCSSRGYVYSGKVVAIGANSIRVQLSSQGVTHDSAPTR